MNLEVKDLGFSPIIFHWSPRGGVGERKQRKRAKNREEEAAETTGRPQQPIDLEAVSS